MNKELEALEKKYRDELDELLAVNSNHTGKWLKGNEITTKLLTVQECIKSLTPPTADEIVKEYKLLKGYEDKRIEYKDGNFIYYPMDKGIMKNTHITLAGRDRNGYRIQGPITKEFMHKITSFFMGGTK